MALNIMVFFFFWCTSKKNINKQYGALKINCKNIELGRNEIQPCCELRIHANVGVNLGRRGGSMDGSKRIQKSILCWFKFLAVYLLLHSSCRLCITQSYSSVLHSLCKGTCLYKI